jgi:hypothetical protein
MLNTRNIVEYKNLISYDTMTGLLRFDRGKHYFSLSIVNLVYIFNGYLYVSVRIPKGVRVFKCRLPKDISYEELIILDDVLCDINDYIKSDGLNEYRMKCSDIFQEYNLCGMKFDYVDNVMLFLLIAIISLLIGIVVW